MVNKRRGRPTGDSDVRQRLLDAAQQHFARGDLVSVSSRALAAEVGVSHTLVNYHFGSRDALVAAAGSLRAAPHDVIAMSRHDDGSIDLTRLAHGILAVWEHPVHGQRLATLARQLTSGGGSGASIAAYLQHAVFQPLVDEIGRDHARRLAAAIVGFIFGRYVLELPVFASLTREEAGALLLSMLR